MIIIPKFRYLLFANGAEKSFCALCGGGKYDVSNKLLECVLIKPNGLRPSLDDDGLGCCHRVEVVEVVWNYLCPRFLWVLAVDSTRSPVRYSSPPTRLRDGDPLCFRIHGFHRLSAFKKASAR